MRRPLNKSAVEMMMNDGDDDDDDIMISFSTRPTCGFCPSRVGHRSFLRCLFSHSDASLDTAAIMP